MSGRTWDKRQIVRRSIGRQSEGRLPESVSQGEIASLREYLAGEYDRGVDGGLIRNFFRRLKINMRNETVKALTNQVMSLHENSVSMQDYERQLRTYNDVLYYMCIGKILEAKNAVEKAQEEHKTLVARHVAEQANLETEVDHRRIINMRELIENERLKNIAEQEYWRAKQDKSRYHLFELRGEVIKLILKKLKVGNIKLGDASLLVAALMEIKIDPQIVNADQVYELLRAQVNQEKARAAKTREEARTQRAERKHKEFKYEESRRKPGEDDED